MPPDDLIRTGGTCRLGSPHGAASVGSPAPASSRDRTSYVGGDVRSLTGDDDVDGDVFDGARQRWGYRLEAATPGIAQKYTALSALRWAQRSLGLDPRTTVGWFRAAHTGGDMLRGLTSLAVDPPRLWVNVAVDPAEVPATVLHEARHLLGSDDETDCTDTAQRMLPIYTAERGDRLRPVVWSPAGRWG